MFSRDFREKARQMLRGKWGTAVAVTFVAAIFGGLVTANSFSLEIDEELLAKLPEIIRIYLTAVIGVSSTLNLVVFILGGTVRLGYCKYLLNLHDGKPGDIKDLFSEFGRFRDGFVLSLLTTLYIFLWTLLFIIPGIVAAYKYAMAPFIMLENPGMKPREAINESEGLMYGNKGKLFALGWSFFGWGLLNLLTLGIGSFWLDPYINASYAAFYRHLRPRMPESTVEYE